MADLQISGLSAKTALADADQLALDNTGNVSYKITGANLRKGFSSFQGVLNNGRLDVTVASNNLTVALKTLAGNDPSANDIVTARIGDTLYSITAALSVTRNAGTSWCNSGSAELATKEVDYFAYLGYNATDGVVLGFSRIPYANQYSEFSTTATNEKYAAISTTTNAAATDFYQNIGRFAATLSAGAGFTWTVPTCTALNLVQRPIYETRILTWAPLQARSGGAYVNPPTVTVANYAIIGRGVEFLESHTQHATPGSSGYQYFTLPFTPSVARPVYAFNVTALTGFTTYLNGAAGANTASLFRYDGNQECTGAQVYGSAGYFMI